MNQEIQAKMNLINGSMLSAYLDAASHALAGATSCVEDPTALLAMIDEIETMRRGVQ